MHYKILPDLIPFKKGKYWGYSNKQKHIVIDCEYYKTLPFSHGLAKVQNRNNYWSLIDINGDTITKHLYSEIQGFKYGLAGVKRNDNWGYINASGFEVIDCKYAGAFPFSEGLARVKNEETYKWGFIDELQNVIVDFSYNEASDFQNSVAIVRKKNEWGIVNKFGVLISPCIYKSISKFENNLAVIEREIDNNSYRGIIDINGVEVVPCEMHYTQLRNFISCNHDSIIYRYVDSYNCYRKFEEKNSFQQVLNSFNIEETNEEGKYLIDEDDLQKIPISTIYNSITPVFENIAIMDKEGKYGLLDNLGEEITPPNYQELIEFSDKYFASINDKNLWGLLAHDGTVILPNRFSYIKQFTASLFIVSETLEELWDYKYYGEKSPCWLVQKNGNPLNNIKYDAIDMLSIEYSQLASVRKEDKYGFINQNGKEIIQCKYSYIKKVTDDLLLVEKENLYGMINFNGEEVMICKYHWLHFDENNSLCYGSRYIKYKGEEESVEGYIDLNGNEYWEIIRSV